jgi:hypothetical protein
MKVGDGFEAPRDMGRSSDGKKDRRAGSICCSANTWARRNNSTAKFTTICVNENTVRCVRIA